MQVDKIKEKYFVNVTQDEALRLIKSLTNQLINNSGNVGRLESYTDDGEYFSIFVLDDAFHSTNQYKEWVKEQNGKNNRI